MRILRDLWGDGDGAQKLIEDMPPDGDGAPAEESEPSEPCPHCGGVKVREVERAPRPGWRTLLHGIWVLVSIAFMLFLPAPRHIPTRHCPDCDWEW